MKRLIAVLLLAPTLALAITKTRNRAIEGALVSIIDYGCKGDFSTDCKQALISAATVAAGGGTGGIVHFPFVAGAVNTYYFSAFFPEWIPSETTFDVDPGVLISMPDSNIGALSGRGFKFTRPAKVDFRDMKMGVTMGATDRINKRDPPPVKDQWIDNADLNRSSLSPVLANTAELTPLLIPWNIGDTWTSTAFTSSTASSFTFTPGIADGSFRVGFRRVLPGDELTAAVQATAGNPYLVAMIRTSAGYYGFQAGSDAAASTMSRLGKDGGVAGVLTAVTTPWQGNHASYAPGYSVWSIRVDAWNRAAILMNGYVVATFTPPGAIFQAGFGLIPTTTADSVTVSNIVVARRKAPTNGTLLSLRVFGDSRAAPRIDCWPDFLPAALEFTAGIRVSKIDVIAVAGENSSQQWTRMQSVGVSDVDVVVIDVGTNDVQGLVSVATYLSNITNMVNTAIAAAKLTILVNFDLWYTQGQAGIGVGQASQNYEQGAPYRSAVLRLAAEKGLKVIDSPSITGPILSHYRNAGMVPNLIDAGDPTVTDNIHPTSLANRLRAREVAKAIVGALLPASGALALPDIPLTSFAANGWTGATQAPFASIDASGAVTFDGLLDAGTRTDGTTILALPAHLWPARTKRFKIYSSVLSETPTLLVASDGSVKVYGLPAGTYVALDSLTWNIDPRLGY